MGRITVLDSNTVNKIAAGEVVERPASVDKELLDNALDARATRITITLEQGGRGLVQVSDDGMGMPPEDIGLAVQRHATSKLQVIEDLCLEIVMQTMVQTRLQHWTAPPLVMVHPRVEHIGLLGFGHNRELVEEGYRATLDVLDGLGDGFDPAGHGIHPQRPVEIRIDRPRCIGCGMCVMQAPWLFEMDDENRARVRHPIQSWSPLDGAYVRHCPTYAISSQLAPERRQTIRQHAAPPRPDSS